MGRKLVSGYPPSGPKPTYPHADHPWKTCCRSAGLDLSDIQPVWGFGEKISLRQWISRVYAPEHPLNEAAFQAWGRLKRRLRQHGLKISVPDFGDSNFMGEGGKAGDVKPGDWTWLSLDNTQENRQVAYDMLKALDDDLLSVPEERWADKERAYKEWLRRKARGGRH